jgi:hypothetical protein
LAVYSLSYDVLNDFVPISPLVTTALAVPGTHGENVTPEDFKVMARGVLANFGTWSVNEAEKTLTLRSEEGLFRRPAGGGGENKLTVSVTADEMKVSGPGGGSVWRRYK